MPLTDSRFVSTNLASILIKLRFITTIQTICCSIALDQYLQILDEHFQILNFESDMIHARILMFRAVVVLIFHGARTNVTVVAAPPSIEIKRDMLLPDGISWIDSVEIFIEKRCGDRRVATRSDCPPRRSL